MFILQNFQHKYNLKIYVDVEIMQVKKMNDKRFPRFIHLFPSSISEVFELKLIALKFYLVCNIFDFSNYKLQEAISAHSAPHILVTK